MVNGNKKVFFKPINSVNYTRAIRMSFSWQW